jgi:nucleotide-binding universal stress UspA family protein
VNTDERPVVVGFDGSNASVEAMREAAALFRDRMLVVVTVWEPALALAMTRAPDDLSGLSSTAPDPETMAVLDGLQRDHATDTAAAGAELARTLGATVDPHPVSEELSIAETIAGVAEQRDAAAIVVGSRGLGRIKSALLGSTSQGLLHRAKRPVVVVRPPA